MAGRRVRKTAKSQQQRASKAASEKQQGQEVNSKGSKQAITRAEDGNKAVKKRADKKPSSEKTVTTKRRENRQRAVEAERRQREGRPAGRDQKQRSTIRRQDPAQGNTGCRHDRRREVGQRHRRQGAEAAGAGGDKSAGEKKSAEQQAGRATARRRQERRQRRRQPGAARGQPAAAEEARPDGRIVWRAKGDMAQSPSTSRNNPIPRARRPAIVPAAVSKEAANGPISPASAAPVRTRRPIKAALRPVKRAKARPANRLAIRRQRKNPPAAPLSNKPQQAAAAAEPVGRKSRGQDRRPAADRWRPLSPGRHAGQGTRSRRALGQRQSGRRPGPGRSDAAATPPEPIESPADQANLEYARRQTTLALEHFAISWRRRSRRCSNGWAGRRTMPAASSSDGRRCGRRPRRRARRANPPENSSTTRCGVWGFVPEAPSCVPAVSRPSSRRICVMPAGLPRRPMGRAVPRVHPRRGQRGTEERWAVKNMSPLSRKWERGRG